MPCKDLVSWNVMITGYVKQGNMESARELFDQVPQRDVVTWNTMITGYVRFGTHEEAMKMVVEMQQAGERPDEVTMLSLLSACSDSGALDVGEKIHQALLEIHSRNDLNVVLGNALVDMYAKCGCIEKALEVFNGMREKDVSSWNSIIGGLAFHGHAEESISLFEEMRKKRTKPNDITFVSVLVACSHGGMVERGREYFKLMRTEYGIEPNVRHYGCMVDILGRAGFLEEASKFVDEMKVEPDAIVWRALLGACRIHGNVDLGEHANKQLLKLRGGASGDYVLLSNIYASMGKWGGKEKLRKLMDDRKVAKEAGFAQIEGKNEELISFLLRPLSECTSSVIAKYVN
ncbi:pentatricopeptide repeat-containing protein At5g15300-like [Dioscorea cayenensis subsp. rotundata]|uniref:Pentatricopeptide repeat-containing protein At5g15300-like n=1 Tax=Dioscorea cayennensis subsp. rotundata TaxID=55577 RepID=A0AB40D2Q8_DIOCR|nr:pentatricopeptide repeat-containing protein At5g15300-like [Dioscorea cayenensis subsp. rotundata]